jgi:hypothetical protein
VRACVRCRPAASVLHAVERYVVENAHRLTPKDVKDFLVAFTAMESPPGAQMVNAAILQLPKNFAETLPKDLATLISVRARSSLRARASPPACSACVCRALLTCQLLCRLCGSWTFGRRSRLWWRAPTSPV